MRTIKMTSHYQAIWRANLHIKNNTQAKWRWLEEGEIEEIKSLRLKGNTYSFIAKKFNISISAVAKHCKDLDVSFVEFNKINRKGNEKKGRKPSSTHPWVIANKELFNSFKK